MKTPFVILFRQKPRTFTAAELAERQAEVSAWVPIQMAAGHNLEPRILGPVVERAGAGADQGYGVSPDSWPVTALLFLEATDLAEATKVAASHPARHYEASMEVRPWAPPGGR